MHLIKKVCDQTGFKKDILTLLAKQKYLIVHVIL